MNKTGLITGSVFGLLAVAIGAFGAHGLKDILEANGRLEVFETGVKYQFYHAMALLVAGILAEKLEGLWVTRAIYLFTAGVIIFSGSLYVLSLSDIGIFGAITPIGGVLLILGWVSLIIAIRNYKA